METVVLFTTFFFGFGILKCVILSYVLITPSPQFVTITIMIHVVADSTNTMTLLERRSRNRVLVHAITRKKEIVC
jgi:hypothetical protein